MKILYRFIEEENLLIQQYTGNFSLEHYIDYVKIIIKTKEWNFVKKILSDFRKIDFEKAFNSLQKLEKIRRKSIKKEFYNVFLVDSPKTTVFAHLYQNNQAVEYKYNYCSTIDYAHKLLELNMTKNELELILNNLNREL